MKIPELFESIFRQKSKRTNVYISLYLDSFHVAASFWSVEADGSAKVLASEFSSLVSDSWEARGQEVDKLLGVLEEKTGHTDVTKSILGLPPAYLTATGEIRKDVRMQIKNFTQELELEAIGFVPLQQAVIYKMKKDEGVPPSVILLGINDQNIAVGVYKIGDLVGVRDIEKHEDVVDEVEQGLKSFTDLEVLPARILLYGAREDELEEMKGKLLKHQWTSKVNFLHFPKIDILSMPVIIESVSLAGASELGAAMDSVESPASSDPVEETEQTESGNDIREESEDEILESSEAVEALTSISESDSGMHTAVADRTPKDDDIPVPSVSEEVADAQEVISEDFAIDETAKQDANVVMVDAESLGFKKDVDVLEEEQIADDIPDDDDADTRTETLHVNEAHRPERDVSAAAGGIFRKISGIIPHRGNTTSLIFVGVCLTVLAALLYALYWFLPHAAVTIMVIPKSIESAQSITIDPNATTTDGQNLVIPGRKREKSVSGEKTIPVKGKKSIGDPAKGTVTVYNKSLSSKTFKKGTVLVSGSLQFTLDADVQIASASESIGSITFGKSDVAVTAYAIGAQSNLAAGSEFTFKEVSANTAIARNDKALAGGNSREITVVSRADYDSFVKTVSDDLIVKAKEELSKSVDNSEKLIDATIKTTVTEKVFNQEIEEEATQLQGKLTITVSGIAFSESDVRVLLTSLSSDKIPNGYTVNENKTTVSVSDVTVKKDGKITADAEMKANAVPTFNIESIQKAIAGKSIARAQEHLKSLPGIGGISISFKSNPLKSQLPINPKNVSLIFTTFE